MNDKGPTAGSTRTGVLAEGPTDGFVLMDLAFQAIAMDRGAAAILKTDVQRVERGKPASPTVSPLTPILESLQRVVGGDTTGPKPTLYVGGYVYSATTFRIWPRDGSFPQGIAIYFERERETADVVLEAAAAYDLTDREIEAVRGLALGLASKEIAARMDISPATVKSFLHMIMAKVGAPNRAGIVAKLLGVSDGKAPIRPRAREPRGVR